MHIIESIAKELGVQQRQVKAAVALLDDGATVPFIARYRKEVTENLDDQQLRSLEKRLQYLRDFQARQTTILQSIDKQGLLTDVLKKRILSTSTLTRLEDLYLPFKPKRRSKASVAKEAGLQPLAWDIWKKDGVIPEAAAQDFVDAEKGIEDVAAALAGAQDILIECFSEDADVLQSLRRALKQSAVIKSDVVKKRQDEAEKFQDYFDYSELLKKVPSHRALALFRGQSEGFLRVKLLENKQADSQPFVSTLAAHFQVQNRQSKAYAFLSATVDLTWKKLLKRFQADLFQALKEQAEEGAIQVFGDNLRDLILAAPAGQRATIGLDPGIRTGVKVAVVDQHGKLLDTTVIYPHPPKKRWQESIAALAVLADKHKFELVAIGNGTGSRETEALVADLCKQFPQLPLTSVVVSEAGASVYSASEQAFLEFPDLDVSLRGAVSIARRLQDPLAELVKIDPKAIGVGQYQHDVNQAHLGQALEKVVEDCVNHVGVDVNTASVELLTHVSGLSTKVAQEIVRTRDESGAFNSREQLKKVKGVGPKSFEQAAGFLRILNGENPLDASAVHPESYALVQHILQQAKLNLADVLAKPEVVAGLSAEALMAGKFGQQTVQDVLKELEKPGRDPRPSFKTATFKKGVHEIRDLREGMVLEGVVSNVTNFGAFVDIGVHQDGLVHISALADVFVDDPRKVVKTGQVVQVKVLEADAKRKRISLSMRLKESVEEQKKGQQGYALEQQIKKSMHKKPRQGQNRGKKQEKGSSSDSALAAAFAKAMGTSTSTH